MKDESNRLKKLSRTALLEILVDQSKELDRLREENALLRLQISEAEDEQCHSREVALVAAALLKVNTVLERAERAAERAEGKQP